MCEFNSPALRISNIVKGRERRPDGRVVYYLDPLGENGDPANKKLIPERLFYKDGSYAAMNQSRWI